MIRLAALVLLAALGILSAWRIPLPVKPAGVTNGWGIDACLSPFALSSDVPAYLKLLQTSGIQWVRERQLETPNFASGAAKIALGHGPSSVWQQEKSAGLRVLAFTSAMGANPPEYAEEQLPLDLIHVYRESQKMSARASNVVDAWEMCGEPETFYMADLPDRVVAYQKAVYLGIKAGIKPEGYSEKSLRREFRPRKTPIVLMGALAFPPGPWLDDAAANGLYDYTDAINFHHYGFASSLTGVAEAQREFAARWVRDRRLPLWLTEVGLNNVPFTRSNDSVARKGQADYLLQCARQAIDQRLAVFMPFILVHPKDPFAMTESPTQTFPSWRAYRDFTLEHRLETREIASPPRSPNPVVLQWIPGLGTNLPSKSTRSYWFERDEAGSWLPLEGKIQAYNLGETPQKVRLSIEADPALNWAWKAGPGSHELILPPMGRMAWPIVFRATGNGYSRQSFRVVAQTSRQNGSDNSTASLRFALETPPSMALRHEAIPLVLSAPPRSVSSSPRFAYVSGDQPYELSDDNTPWVGINGAKLISNSEEGFVFDVQDRNVDPLSPPMVVAALPQGLPAGSNGFLRVREQDATDKSAADLRVDLIDQDGQRFSIVENLGRNRLVETTDTVFLGYRDFHPWVFGRCVPGREKMDPTRIREIQLRFFNAGAGKRFQVQLAAVIFGN